MADSCFSFPLLDFTRPEAAPRPISCVAPGMDVARTPGSLAK